MTAPSRPADIFTTDPSVSKYHFVALADPMHLFAAQNVIPIINKSVRPPPSSTTLNAVSAALTTGELVQLVGAVVNDHVDARHGRRAVRASRPSSADRRP